MADQVLESPPALAPDDPFLREAQTFPQLAPEMAGRVAAWGVEQRLAPGETVYARGERQVDFFLVLEGSVEIVDLDAHGRPHVIVVHRERQFTGELDLFTGREVLVSARAGPAGQTRVVRIPRAEFRRLITAEPDFGEIVMRAYILRRVGLIRHAQGGAVLIGPGHGAETLRLQRFLTRNSYPHRLYDTELDPDADGFLAAFHITPDQLPVVIIHGETVLRDPGAAALADALGLTERVDPAHAYDLVVVGGGPAGLAAAVYGASEGLDTLVIEAVAPGGQAGTSSKIENYLGFPTGISGQALAARAQVQAQKFGARLLISREASALDCSVSPFRLSLDDGQTVSARTVVIASGARYRRLGLPEEARYEGAGLHYAATAMEARLCAGEEVAVVGGGNSAGQAAIFLAREARHVHLLVRAEGLAATMSDYLIQRIASAARITLHAQSQITTLAGEDRLRQVTWTDRRTGQAQTRAIGNVFVMIGADPNTGWLEGCVDLDDRGFVLTGGLGAESAFATSKSGIYAVGDVRSGSIKRVASSVGEGSVVVQGVHQHLHGAG